MLLQNTYQKNKNNMPCIKCANGKWKYGEHGNCQFDTLTACKQAAAAIHIQEENTMKPKTPTVPADPKPPAKKPKKPGGAIPIQPEGPHVPAMPRVVAGMEPKKSKVK